MEPFRTALRLQAALYPAMLPQDALKIAYESVFGGGILPEAEDVLAEKMAVPATARVPDRPFEFLGGQMRVQLNHPVVKALPAALLARIVHVSYSEKYSENPGEKRETVQRLTEEFSQKKEILRQEAQAGLFSFSAEQLAEYLRRYAFRQLYEDTGLPVHHSRQYKERYAPAYCVADSRFAAIWPLLLPLAGQMQRKGRFTLALDGMAASGKTTAAALLQKVFGGSVVHMDDFFLPKELRTPQRLAAPGGNVHYERFCAEVLAPLRRGLPFSYRVFDCRCMDYAGESAVINPAHNVIIEGSYALHPQFGPLPPAESWADTAAFLRIAPSLQEKRILHRSGEEKLQMFLTRWIPMENAYRAANEARLRPYFLPEQQEDHHG